MLNSDDGCIRYLMKEMDPSEEMEFERMMLEDEDLLIEVETLRNTLRRLNKLPELSPPDEVLSNIRNSPAYREKVLKGRRNNPILRYTAWSAAAAILLFALSGVYLLQDYSAGADTSEQQNLSAAGSVDPWVDRDQVLKYTGEYALPVETELSAEYDQSYEKLKLVRSLNAPNASGRSLILTGTSR